MVFEKALIQSIHTGKVILDNRDCLTRRRYNLQYTVSLDIAYKSSQTRVLNYYWQMSCTLY